MRENFFKHLQVYLNKDPELGRRLAGFRTFSGTPDGHYKRARQGGNGCIARAVRCYPFGGKSHFGDDELVGIELTDTQEKYCISIKDGSFGVKTGDWEEPHLGIRLSKELFRKTVLGRHRWVWVLGMEDVDITYSENLPHSDWVTILEVLVTMQEVVEFVPELWTQIEAEW
jgi:hypothetical protein